MGRLLGLFNKSLICSICSLNNSLFKLPPISTFAAPKAVINSRNLIYAQSVHVRCLVAMRLIAQRAKIWLDILLIRFKLDSLRIQKV